MSLETSLMTGPDFLEHVAEAELANGNLFNAQEYHRRAIQWREDQEALAAARERLANVEDRLHRLQVAVAECAS